MNILLQKAWIIGTLTGQENSTNFLVLNESSIYNILVVERFIFIYTTIVAEDSSLVECSVPSTCQLTNVSEDSILATPLDILDPE